MGAQKLCRTAEERIFKVVIFKSKDIMFRKVFSTSGYTDNVQTCLQEILFIVSESGRAMPLCHSP